MPSDRHLAREIVLQHGWNAVSYQILNPGMLHWFSAAGDAVVGYARFAHTRVVAGAPACAEHRLADVAVEFEEASNAAGDAVAYFAAGSRLEQLLAARGTHVMVSMGAQPVWDPRDWGEVVRTHASLRAQLHRARNKGVQVSEWPSARASGPELRQVLQQWLDARAMPPMSFLVTPDVLGMLEDRRVFVAERAGHVVAYLVATPVPARNGWLVEQWPRLPHAPNGTTHLLVDTALRAFAEYGSTYATLGLAPLSTRAGAAATPPLWLRTALRGLRAHGGRYYNFRGLEAFKASLQPCAWEPVYAIAQGSRFTPATLRAIAGVFSGGAPTRFLLRSLLR